MWTKLIECVPNISEGRRRGVVEQIAAAASGEGRQVIDLSLDEDHHRSVITLVGHPEGLLEGVLHLVRETVERIDLRQHRGAHPRMGAVDVIPFVPIRGVTMADCVDLSHRAGERIAREFGIPVYLYEESATRDARRNLARIRQGQFERLAEKMADPEWHPDYGNRVPTPPPVPWPSAPASFSSPTTSIWPRPVSLSPKESLPPSVSQAADYATSRPSACFWKTGALSRYR